MATIKILTKTDTITINGIIDFPIEEMPVGAKGFRFNGSSHANVENLEKYWKFVEEVFLESKLSTDDYVTLLEIKCQ